MIFQPDMIDSDNANLIGHFPAANPSIMLFNQSKYPFARNRCAV